MYIDILLKWNARINLTAIRDEEQIVTRHFGESFFAATRLFPGCVGADALVDPAKRSSPEGMREERHTVRHDLEGHDLSRADGRSEQEGALAPDARVADVGSGAGFPGIPIKLWAPHISLTLIESNHKKATFLREVTRALTLTDVNIQTARAETIPATTKFDVVTLRAVERFEAILPIAASLLAHGGRVALLIGAAQLDQARTILPFVTWRDPDPIHESHSRVLLLGRKIADSCLEP